MGAKDFTDDRLGDALGELKVLLATLDPLALPVVTLVVAGNRADEELYTPAIQATKKPIWRCDRASELQANVAHSGT